jgi:basic membrane protein A and related proteins
MEEPGPVSAWQRRLQLSLIACSLLALGAVQLATAVLSGQSPTASTSSLEDFTNPVPRMAIAYDVDGRGTAGFNVLVWEGAKRAAAYWDAELEEISAGRDDTDADREQRLADLAKDRYYPIFAVGSSWAGALAAVAPKFPDTIFSILDDATVDAHNVIGIQFNDEQGSFLVGAAAALTSKTGTVGFVGAVRTPALEKFEAGFAAGVRAANPRVTVQVAYLARPPSDAGSSDPAAARKVALGMYDAGADVIFAASGDAGGGVIEAAHERGLWAIGANSDQYLLSSPSVRGAILTSMLKRADVATYAISMDVAMGVPKDGNNVFGLDRGAVGFSTSGGFVDPIKAQLDAFAARIAKGQILVPTRP